MLYARGKLNYLSSRLRLLAMLINAIAYCFQVYLIHMYYIQALLEYNRTKTTAYLSPYIINIIVIEIYIECTVLYDYTKISTVQRALKTVMYILIS